MREKVINEGGTISNDPRVDSPEVKVIYPPEQDDTPISVEANENSNGDTTDQPNIPESQEVKEEHICKVSIQKAIEQNWLYFSLIAVALFGLGYALGKSKVK